LAFYQFLRPRPGQSGSPVNQIYLTTLTGTSATSELLLNNGTSPTWLPGLSALLVYTVPPSGGIAIPHSVDTRTATRYPLTGIGEDAYYYDWKYVGAP
jgi:hypothetical protein